MLQLFVVMMREMVLKNMSNIFVVIARRLRFAISCRWLCMMHRIYVGQEVINIRFADALVMCVTMDMVMLVYGAAFVMIPG
mmetsp:Transcript_17851/g.14878  ORF Transcript_17851/g.14878 Transcript_17851/m.14878 type:complete len:81 (+) Transcript_17851:107-349(+)